MATNIAKIQIRRDTQANWITYDPVLALGEWALEVHPNGDLKTKLGDGTTKWTELPYSGGGSGSGFTNLSYEKPGEPLVPYIDLASAVQTVAENDRGLAAGILFYNSTRADWEVWTYTGQDLTDVQWYDTDNWDQILLSSAGLVQAETYFTDPGKSGGYVYYVNSATTQTLQIGSREFPYVSLQDAIDANITKVDVQIIVEDPLRMGLLGDFSVLNNRPNYWSVTAPGVRVSVTVKNITSISSLTFTNLELESSVTHPVQNFSQCLLNFRHCVWRYGRLQFSTIGAGYPLRITVDYSRFEKDIWFPYSLRPLFFVANYSEFSVDTTTALSLTSADNSSMITLNNCLIGGGSGTVSLTSQYLYLSNTAFDWQSSSITVQNLQVNGLAVEQVVDRSISRFKVLAPASIAQKDINTAIDTALQTQAVDYNYPSNVYIDSGNTTDTARNGTINHPWISWLEALANLTINTPYLIHVGVMGSEDVTIHPYSTYSGTQAKSSIGKVYSESSLIRFSSFKNLFINNLDLLYLEAGSIIEFENCTINQFVSPAPACKIKFKNCSFMQHTFVNAGTVIFEGCTFTSATVFNPIHNTIEPINSILIVSGGDVYIYESKLTLQQNFGTVQAANCSFLPNQEMMDGAFDISVTGGAIYLISSAKGDRTAINIGAGVDYNLGQFMYNESTSSIDPSATNLLYVLQSSQIRDAQAWTLIQPESIKQSDINKALDASLSQLNRIGSNRGEVLSAYEPATAWLVSGVTIASGQVYTVDTLPTIVQPGDYYVSGDRVTIGHGTVWEVETDESHGIGVLSVEDLGFTTSASPATYAMMGSVTGTGATLDITWSACYYSDVSLDSGGQNYVVGDVLQTQSADIQNLQLRVDSIVAGVISTFTILRSYLGSTPQTPSTIIDLYDGTGTGATLVVNSSTAGSCVNTYTRNNRGQNYRLADIIQLDTFTGAVVPKFKVIRLDDEIAALHLIDPGLSATDFGGSSIATTTLSGIGSGLYLDVTTTASTLPAPTNYKARDLIILRSPEVATISAAYFIVDAVTDGVPTSLTISAPGAYLHDIADIFPTGTSGQGSGLFVTIQDTETAGETLRKFLVPPDGTATPDTAAKSGDTVRVLRDENYGGAPRDYIYADFGSGTYKFVPKSGAPASSNYTDDGLFTLITLDKVITLTPRTQSRISGAVQNTGDEVINGVKTFSTSPKVPAKSTVPSITAASVLATEAQVAKAASDIDGGEWS